MVVQLLINDPKGEDKIIKLCDNGEQMKKITVMQLKEKIQKQLDLRHNIRMIFRTKELEESSLVMSYGITHMSTICVTLLVIGGI